MTDRLKECPAGAPAAYRILLIEDNPGDVRLIKEMLHDAHGTHSLVIGNDLKSGFALVENAPPDLVLLDLWLPDSQGLETFENVRRELRDIPVVILSGLNDEVTAREAVALGAQDYLVKGCINESALKRALRYSLERHRIEAERRALEFQLANSRKLESIGQLAAGIAHEINTPTQYVSDNARFLREAFSDVVTLLRHLQDSVAANAPLSTSEIRPLLEKADVDYLVQEIPRALDQSLDGLGQISKIVRAMKEFSHPAKEEKSPTDLNKALQTTATVASNEWKYVADVEFDLDLKLPLVSCLPAEMNQVFLNLIVNAAHAISETADPAAGSKGKITISTRSLNDQCVEIRVKDTGCGIAPEHRNKVFDPFFTTKEVGKGTGQGLAISYNIIVKRHGGTIDFDSTPGQGTSFNLRLPLARIPVGTT